MHYVYILHSEAADKFYVGQTTDLETRLLFHNELSENSFTSRYRPWKLAKVIAVNNRSEAMINREAHQRQEEQSLHYKAHQRGESGERFAEPF